MSSDDERDQERTTPRSKKSKERSRFSNAIISSTSSGSTRVPSSSNSTVNFSSNEFFLQKIQQLLTPPKTSKSPRSKNGNNNGTINSLTTNSFSPLLSFLQSIITSSNYNTSSSSSFIISTINPSLEQQQYTLTISSISTYLFSHLTKLQLQSLLQHLVKYVNQEFANLFHYSAPFKDKTDDEEKDDEEEEEDEDEKEEGIENKGVYQASSFPNRKAARLYALQYSLHRRAMLSKLSSSFSSPSFSSSSSSSSSPSAPKFASQPRIYLTEGSPLYNYVERFSFELMLSKSSFKIIPLIERKEELNNNNLSKSRRKGKSIEIENQQNPIVTYMMDIEALEKQIQADLKRGHLPVAVFATIGSDIHSGLQYQFDDLRSIRKVCDQHQLWLHTEGSGLLLATLSNSSPSSPSSSPFLYSDSICSDLLPWFSLPGALAISFFRLSSQISNLIVPSAPLSRESLSNLMLVWWQFIITKGEEKIENKVEKSIKLGYELRKIFEEESDNLKTLCSPSSADTDIFPHQLFFQFQIPSDSNNLLSELHLTTNDLNRWIYYRLIAPNPDPYSLAGYEKTRREEDNDSNDDDEDHLQLRRQAQLDRSRLHSLFTTSFSLLTYNNLIGILYHPFSSSCFTSSLFSFITNNKNEKDDTEIIKEAVEEEIQLLEKTIEARNDIQKAIKKHNKRQSTSPSSSSSSSSSIPDCQFIWVDPSELPATTFVGLGAFHYKPNQNNNNNNNNYNNNFNNNNNNVNNNNNGNKNRAPCRFWAQGRCKNGDKCTYRHDPIEGQQRGGGGGGGGGYQQGGGGGAGGGGGYNASANPFNLLNSAPEGSPNPFAADSYAPRSVGSANPFEIGASLNEPASLGAGLLGGIGGAVGGGGIGIPGLGGLGGSSLGGGLLGGGLLGGGGGINNNVGGLGGALGNFGSFQPQPLPTQPAAIFPSSSPSQPHNPVALSTDFPPGYQPSCKHRTLEDCRKSFVDEMNAVPYHFTSYKHDLEMPIVIEGCDISYEEQRLQFYIAQQQGPVALQQLEQQLLKQIEIQNNKKREVYQNPALLHGDALAQFAGGLNFFNPLPAKYQQQQQLQQQQQQLQQQQQQQQAQQSGTMSNWGQLSGVNPANPSNPSSALFGGPGGPNLLNSAAASAPASAAPTVAVVNIAPAPSKLASGLSAAEIEQVFRAPAFTYGLIPEIPPPSHLK